MRNAGWRDESRSMVHVKLEGNHRIDLKDLKDRERDNFVRNDGAIGRGREGAYFDVAQEKRR